MVVEISRAGETPEAQAPQQVETQVSVEPGRRRFLGTLLGAGAGAATAYSFGRPQQAQAGEVMELAADDPHAPEEVSSLVTEGSVDKLQLAEQVAEMIKSGAIQPQYAEGSPGALAAVGALGVVASGNETEERRMGRRELIAGLLGGTILVSAADFARAQELAFVSNYNSNVRSGSVYTSAELDRLASEEAFRRKRISLEEFTRMAACESPRGARLFAQYEAVKTYNEELREKKKRGEASADFVSAPITPYWYRKPSTAKDSVLKFSFFRLRDQVLIPDNNGGQQKVFKHYGVAQDLEMDTRSPHFLVWSGYLGTDRQKGQEAMEKARQNY